MSIILLIYFCEVNLFYVIKICNLNYLKRKFKIYLSNIKFNIKRFPGPIQTIIVHYRCYIINNIYMTS